MKPTLACRTALLALVASLLTIFGAQAQIHSTAANNPTTSQADFNWVSTGADHPMVVQNSRMVTDLSAPPAPEAGASFYDDSRKDLSQALDWMKETNAIAPTYWNLYTESNIRLKMKDYQGARATAEHAYKLAIKAMPASKEYVMLSANMVAKAYQLAK